MPIKVVSIVSRMNLGGVAILLKEIHKDLNTADYDHTLITGVCSVNELDILADSGNLSKIIQVNKMSRKPSILEDFSSFFEIRKILKEISPDIVHTHTSKAGVLGRIAALSLRKNLCIVHTFHGHHIYGYFSKTIVKTIIFAEQILGNYSDLLIADSVQVKDDLRKVGIGKSKSWRVITPGVRELAQISNKEARSRLAVDKDMFTICWIGRFVDIKNPILALTAYSMLNSFEKSHSKFIMVGDGELLEKCKAFAKANNLNVSFPGWEMNIAPFLAASNLLLLTSRNEGFGMVLAESGQYGVPALSTDVGGVREFIENNENGILVEAYPEAIASTISYLMKNPTSLIKLGENARKTSAEKFSMDNFIQKHKEIYLDLNQKNT
jgi:glycosyltransferase involved in cell wall biosynthesis